MLNSKEGFDATLAMHANMFPELPGIIPEDQEEWEMFSFFSKAEISEMKTRIKDYELNPKSRSGGSGLIKKIENIANAKKELLRFIDDIHDMLQPKERTRTSVKEAEVLAEQRSINKTAESYKKAFTNEKMLRDFATNIIGDVQGDYTVQELPLVIATKQITGTLMSIS